MHIFEMPEVEQMLVVDMLWQWWLERNWVSEGDQRRGPSALAFVVTKQSDEFLTIGEERQPLSSDLAGRKRYSKPESNTYRIG